MSSRHEQLPLFDLGLNLTALRLAKEKLLQASTSPNTAAAYAWAWKIFTKWCEQAGQLTLPASTDTLQLFVTWATKRPYRIATIQLCLAAIAARHRASQLPNPVTGETRRLVSNAARQPHLPPPEKKAALKIPKLRAIVAALGEDPIDLRDRSMLLLAFATGCRRSEIVALNFSDVEFLEHGLCVRIRRSKSDQKGKGREIGVRFGRRISTCPVRQLRRWIDLRGPWHGPLFPQVRYGSISRERLRGRVVCQRLHRVLEKLNEDVSRYGAHSLRAGMITTAVENGASVLAIAQCTGHRTVEMVQKYVRDVEVFMAVDPLKGVL